MRVKRNNSDRAETLSVMHDKALELGFTTAKPPPNWMTENKTPNWNWSLNICPPWIKTEEYQKVLLDWINEFNLPEYIKPLFNHTDDPPGMTSGPVRLRIINYIRFYLYITAPADHDYPSDSTYAEVKYKEALSDLCFRLDQISPWRLQ